MLMLLKSDIPVGNALLYSLLGFAIVFVMLIFLWIVIAIVSKIVKALESGKKSAAPAPAAAPAAAVSAAAASAADEQKAPGSAGEIKLHDVPDKTAAMLMAIVADKLGKPLNELRFISIKEVK